MNSAYNQRFRHLGTDFSELFWRQLRIELVPEVRQCRTRDFCVEGGLFNDDKPKPSPDVPKEIYHPIITATVGKGCSVRAQMQKCEIQMDAYMSQ
jgi:hypothetical protein